MLAAGQSAQVSQKDEQDVLPTAQRVMQRDRVIIYCL
jgi:hypothetical protein